VENVNIVSTCLYLLYYLASRVDIILQVLCQVSLVFCYSFVYTAVYQFISCLRTAPWAEFHLSSILK